MPDRNPFADSSVSSAAESIGERAVNRVNEARESVSEMARAAANKIDDNRVTAADRLESAASVVHERAQQLPGGRNVEHFAHAAADRLSSTADYMRSHDAAGMMADVERVVKNNPGPALVVAAAFGFLVGRALSRD